VTNSPAKIAFVVATKDRPKDIRTMLQSLESQSCRPNQVVIVDSGSQPMNSIVEEFQSLVIKYVRYDRPSASAQRNAGIEAVNEGIELIGFLDDDVVLEFGAVESILRFWRDAAEDVGGCAFNLKNFKRTDMERLKHSSLARLLGLYSPEKGVVMPSGWQTMIGTVQETTYVQWLPSTAAVWRRSVIERFRFEEYFGGYSYLEDLDFSYGVSRQYKLAVVADAAFFHYHSSAGRIDRYKFGKIEVVNRLFFVRKHGLSVPRCYIGLIIRMLMTLSFAAKSLDRTEVLRALGNCSGLVRSLFLRNVRGLATLKSKG